MPGSPLLVESVRSVAAVAIFVAGSGAWAQSRDPAAAFPNHPVRIFVQGGPGSPPDARARLIGSKLAPSLAQPVIVENRPGAGGQLALEQVLQAAPDGHSLILAGQGLFVIAPHVRKMPFDPLKEFVPITQTGIAPLVLVVNPALPVHNVAELIAHAKRYPDKLNAATPGIATTQHLALALFNRIAGTTIADVPYKDGIAQGIVELASGKTDLAFDTYYPIAPYLRSGRLRALAVTGPQRLSVLPDVPTFREAGLPEIEPVFIWAGFFARTGTQDVVVKKLHRAITEILTLPEVRATFIESGGTPITNQPDEFSAFIRAEYARYGKLISDAAIKLD